jgi:superfamily II DNA helicase RecQ
MPVSIQYKFLTIPAVCPEEAEGQLNSLLRSVRLLNVDKEFVVLGERSFWSVAVSFLPDRSPAEKPAGLADRKKVDYREVLSPEDFAVFARLRDWRKQVAAQEAVPVYTIFTNDQLAQMATARTASKVTLMQIEGIGEAKASKHGQAVIDIIRQLSDELMTSGPA